MTWFQIAMAFIIGVVGSVLDDGNFLGSHFIFGVVAWLAGCLSEAFKISNKKG